MWKNICIKICTKCSELLRIDLATEEKPQPSGQKTFPFLMQSCSIQIWCYIRATVTCKNRHRVICCL